MVGILSSTVVDPGFDIGRGRGVENFIENVNV